MAGLVPATSLMEAPRSPDRGRRVKPGDDEGGWINVSGDAL
jgi:hypothetical protein